MAESAGQDNVQELFLANQLLTRVARHGSRELDSFSGWMLGGFGAAFALLLANIEQVSRLIRVENVRAGGLVFLVAILLGVMQKSLASVVASTSAAALEGEALGFQAAAAGADVDIQVLFREFERATLFPFRWVVRRSLQKVVQGDLAAGGRMCVQMSQLQGWVVSFESLLALAAALILVYGLAV